MIYSDSISLVEIFLALTALLENGDTYFKSF